MPSERNHGISCMLEGHGGSGVSAAWGVRKMWDEVQPVWNKHEGSHNEARSLWFAFSQ
jgi:hypothetical protein